MQRVIGLVPLSLAFPVGAQRMFLSLLALHSPFFLSYLLTFSLEFSLFLGLKGPFF